MTVSGFNNYMNYSSFASARSAANPENPHRISTYADEENNGDNNTGDGGTGGVGDGGDTGNGDGGTGGVGDGGDTGSGGDNNTGDGGSGSGDSGSDSGSGDSGSGGSGGSGSGDSGSSGSGSDDNNSGFPGNDPLPSDDEETDNNGLGTEAFMKLFLEQLKNQDPTAPMETQEILTQTAQLTQVEAQMQMKKAMEEMTTTMASMQETNKATIEAQEKLVEAQEKMLETMGVLAGAIQDSSILGGYNTVGMIGNIAETPFTALKVEKNEAIKFDLYFDEPIDPSKGSPKITITDKDNNVIREIDLAEKDEDGNYKYINKEGYIEFEWDTRDNKGNYVEKGDYTVRAEYNLDPETNKYKETQLGRGEVQSILFEGGVPYVKLGDNLTVPIIYVTSYYKKTGEGIDLPDLPDPESRRAS